MVDKNLKQEACQLYIEQQIETGLEDGKSAYKIGKELTKEIDRLFEAKVKPNTIEKRAQRIRTNVRKKTTDKLRTNDVRTDKRSDKPVDSILLTDRKVLESIRSIAHEINMPINDIILLGNEAFRREYM